MTARKLDTFLSEKTSPLSRLAQAAQQLSLLSRIWETVAPIGLARSCRVGRLDDGVLTLLADNGAIASKKGQNTRFGSGAISDSAIIPCLDAFITTH